jgi:hypothetical protein
MTTTTNLTLDSFVKETGFRFRVTKNQAARIALTSLDAAARTTLNGASIEDAANVLENSRNTKGKPFNWVKESLEIVDGWNDSLSLTREGAFQEFLADGGLERLQTRKPEVPDSVYLDPTLTLANFADLAEAVTGAKHRFRMSRDQNVRFKAGDLTREQALAETVASKQTPVAQEEAITVADGIETTGS